MKKIAKLNKKSTHDSAQTPCIASRINVSKSYKCI